MSRGALSGAECEPDSEILVLTVAIPLCRLLELEQMIIHKCRKVGYVFETKWMCDQVKKPSRLLVQIADLSERTRVQIEQWTNAHTDSVKLMKDIQNMRTIRRLQAVFIFLFLILT